jgi:hypothetical protein
VRPDESDVDLPVDLHGARTVVKRIAGGFDVAPTVTGFVARDPGAALAAPPAPAEGVGSRLWWLPPVVAAVVATPVLAAVALWLMSPPGDAEPAARSEARAAERATDGSMDPPPVDARPATDVTSPDATAPVVAAPVTGPVAAPAPKAAGAETDVPGPGRRRPPAAPRKPAEPEWKVQLDYLRARCPRLPCTARVIADVTRDTKAFRAGLPGCYAECKRQP